MRKMNKLVALLLAAVMVLGMMPAMTVQAHAHTHEAALLGVEEHPSIALDTPVLVEITESNMGSTAYFAFTPEVTDLYHFYSAGLEGSNTDTYGHLYNANMEELITNDDAFYPYPVEGLSSPNFCISYVLEAGVTYVFGARLYSAYTTGSFNVVLTQGHDYESAVTKEETCTEDGVLTYTCKHCGKSYDEPIPAAHSYSDETGECIHCGEAYLITGTCGDNLTWSLDWFGKLTISGTGNMYHFIVTWDNNYPAPWYDYTNDIKSVVIEEGVTSVGNYAFYQCGKLAEVTLPSTVTALGTYAFNNCYALTAIELPDGITEIPNYCFNSAGLKEISWPAGLTKIGDNAFSSCMFGDTVLPEGVTYIGENAFRGTSNLKKLTLPSTLTELAGYAFYGMWNTTEFVFTGNAPIIGDNCFNYITATVWYPLGNATWTEDVMQNYGGTLTWKGICSGDHTWSQPTTIEATCEVGSYMTMTCTVCGYVNISPEMSEPLGHDYKTEHYDGGCGNSSYDIVTCSRCDYYETKNWTWTEHNYAVTSVTDATCTEDGFTVYTCTNCGDSYNGNWTYATGHSVTEWGEPSEATCTEPSVKTGVCATCGNAATEQVAPALGHEWDEENGTANDDGSMTYSCIRCDATYRTEGTALYLGDNAFTIAANTGRGTKTFTAEADGTLTITMDQMFYHNAYAWEMGWTPEYWSSLAIDYVLNEGWFNIYVNNQNTAYTLEGSERNAKAILSSIEVKAGDVVTVEVNQTEASYYYDTDVQFNMNLALASANPEPGSDTLALGDNEIELAAYAESDVLTWTAQKDGNLSIEMTKLVMDF